MGPYGRDVEFAIAVLCIAGVFLIVVVVAQYLSERGRDGD